MLKFQKPLPIVRYFKIGFIFSSVFWAGERPYLMEVDKVYSCLSVQELLLVVLGELCGILEFDCVNGKLSQYHSGSSFCPFLSYLWGSPSSSARVLLLVLHLEIASGRLGGMYGMSRIEPQVYPRSVPGRPLLKGKCLTHCVISLAPVLSF